MAGFSLELDDAQRELQSRAHRFARDVMRPVAPEWDEREEMPWPLVEAAAEEGLYSLDFVSRMFSEPTGLSTPLVMEELAWGDAGITLALMGTTLGVTAILAQGSAEQADEWLPLCFRQEDGGVAVAAFAVSEAEAGSDVSSLSTRASYDEARDEWVLDGTKTWINNGGIAGLHVVVAAVDPSLGARGQASFVVPPGSAGLAQGRKFKKMGIRAAHTAEVVLDGCRVPGRCLLGGRERLDERLARAREGRSSGRGQAAMAIFEASRPAVGAQALGVARAAYEHALAYAKERRQFGRAIIENQAIAFKLADMRMAIDACRLLIWRAAWMGKTKRSFEAGEGSMSKLFAGEMAVKVTEEAIQILGGAGYVRDHPVEQWHRDAKIFTIFEASRPAVGAQALGVARAAYEHALAYAKERRQFGRAIVENQAIAFKLADMRMAIDASRLLIWRAAWMGKTKRPFEAGEGSMSKLFAGEMAVKVTEDAIQILGGAGYVRDHPVEQWHRDAKIFTIFEGTSEIQRLIIARAVSGLRLS